MLQSTDRNFNFHVECEIYMYIHQSNEIIILCDLDSNDDNVFLDNEIYMYIHQSNEIIMSHV
jgi:hypothetical protein